MQKVLCYDNINLGHAREIKKHKTVTEIWLHGQAVKTSPFHGGNTGSIPVGVIYADVAQLAEQLICNQQVIGSSPIIGLVLTGLKDFGPLAQLVRAIGS